MIFPPFRFPFSQHPARPYIIFCRFRFPGFRQSGKPFRDFNQMRRTDANTLSHIPAKNRTSMTITLPFLLLSENFHTYTCKFFKIGRSPPTPFYVPADIHRRPVLNRRAIRQKPSFRQIRTTLAFFRQLEMYAGQPDIGFSPCRPFAIERRFILLFSGRKTLFRCRRSAHQTVF